MLHCTYVTFLVLKCHYTLPHLAVKDKRKKLSKNCKLRHKYGLLNAILRDPGGVCQLVDKLIRYKKVLKINRFSKF